MQEWEKRKETKYFSEVITEYRWTRITQNLKNGHVTVRFKTK